LLFLKEKYLMKIDLLVDDAVHNLQAAVVNSNTIPICVDQPWNQNWNGHRIQNIEELPQYLENELPKMINN
jgi:5'(3')-deoxyribonucleotidase